PAGVAACERPGAPRRRVRSLLRAALAGTSWSSVVLAVVTCGSGRRCTLQTHVVLLRRQEGLVGLAIGSSRSGGRRVRPGSGAAAAAEEQLLRESQQDVEGEVDE